MAKSIPSFKSRFQRMPERVTSVRSPRPQSERPAEIARCATRARAIFVLVSKITQRSFDVFLEKTPSLPEDTIQATTHRADLTETRIDYFRSWKENSWWRRCTRYSE